MSSSRKLSVLSCAPILAAALVAAPHADAAEISLLSGLYAKSESETNGQDSGGTSRIQAGGRYADVLDANLGWFADAVLTLRSYDAPSGVDEPSNSTSLSLGGGIRYIGRRWSEIAIPYLWAAGAFRNDRDATFVSATTGYRETETNGLFYGAGIGLRLTIDPTFFVDLEAPFFESALFATTKSKQSDGAGGKTETEESRTELFAETAGRFSNVVVSLGMKL